MSTAAFTKSVARRTRIAAGILGKKSSLDTYTSVYGSEDDLKIIRDRGLEAEKYNAGQSEAEAGGVAGTDALLTAYVNLLIFYRGIMNAVIAVRGEIEEAKTPATAAADDETINRLDAIIKNEAAVHFRSVGEGDKKKLEASASKSQEAVRAEIEKDATNLIALTAAHARLAKRGVDLAKLTKLKTDAAALTGKVISRADKKGGARAATKAEQKAVAAQSHKWKHSYRMLHAAALANTDIAALFTDPTE